MEERRSRNALRSPRTSAPLRSIQVADPPPKRWGGKTGVNRSKKLVPAFRSPSSVYSVCSCKAVLVVQILGRWCVSWPCPGAWACHTNSELETQNSELPLPTHGSGHSMFSAPATLPTLRRPAPFGFRPSDFFRISDFGFSKPISIRCSAFDVRPVRRSLGEGECSMFSVLRLKTQDSRLGTAPGAEERGWQGRIPNLKIRP